MIWFDQSCLWQICHFLGGFFSCSNHQPSAPLTLRLRLYQHARNYSDINPGGLGKQNRSEGKSHAVSASQKLIQFLNQSSKIFFIGIVGKNIFQNRHVNSYLLDAVLLLHTNYFKSKLRKKMNRGIISDFHSSIVRGT